MSEREYKTTEAQRKAIKKYGEKFERINCRFEIGTIDRISKTGMSTNAFINNAVGEKLDNLGIQKTESAEDTKIEPPKAEGEPPEKLNTDSRESSK